MYLDEEDVCACFGEGDGHGLADAACAACYESCLALQGEQFLYGRHVGDVCRLERSEWCGECMGGKGVMKDVNNVLEAIDQ
jgi:hypothetical protein